MDLQSAAKELRLLAQKEKLSQSELDKGPLVTS